MANIVLDGEKAQIVHLDNRTWAEFSSPHYFGGADMWPDFAVDTEGDTGIYGAINIAFRGTSIAFFGTTPIEKASQYVVVSIDGAEPYNAFFQDPTPPSERQWYQTPVLADTTHVVTLNRIPGLSFDYMVIAAGADTPLGGTRLIVDDADPSVSYNGAWTRNDALFTRPSRDIQISGYPYGNASHDSNAQGSSATFRFTGQFPAVYGTINYENLGFVSVKYSLDGFTSIARYNSTPEIQKTEAAFGNNLLFSNESIARGDHTLHVEIIECLNQTFSLDYFLYTPSFETLAQKPGVSGTSSSSSSFAGASSTEPAGAGAGSKSTPVGAIVGGVVSGLVALVLLLFLLLCRRRISERLSSSPLATVMRTHSRKPPNLEPFPVEATSSANVIEVASVPALVPHCKPSTPVTPSSSDRSLASGSSLMSPAPYIGALLADRKLPRNVSREDVTSPPPYRQ